MHVGIMLRQMVNQMLLVAKPWQRAALAAVAVVGGLTMIPVGIMLGHYEMSLGGALILAVVGRMGFVMRRARRADKNVSR